MLTEKQRIEKATAEIFLRLFNSSHHFAFEIQALADSPDVACVEPSTGRRLTLEITLLEDVQGDVAYLLGRGEKPLSPTTHTTAVSFDDDSAAQLQGLLAKKLLSSYGPNTALVIRQVSPLWEPSDWDRVAPEFRQIMLAGSERNYGAGVWIICTDNTTFPAGDALFCLGEPVNCQWAS